MDCWKTTFLLGRPLFSGNMLVSGRVYKPGPIQSLDIEAPFIVISRKSADMLDNFQERQSVSQMFYQQKTLQRTGYYRWAPSRSLYMELYITPLSRVISYNPSETYLFSAIYSGQIIATVPRRLVTPNGGDCKGIFPKSPKNSGLGISS